MIQRHLISAIVGLTLVWTHLPAQPHDSAHHATVGDKSTSATTHQPSQNYIPVETPNGVTLPYTWDNGVKVFHLIAEPVVREFTNGFTVNCWGYNGQTPGPTIEAVEGDRVRFLVTNKLPEPTSVHWHGVILPAGMDGLGGLTQPHIQPGETYQYEFTLRQHGTQMYHPHSDEMNQIALGMVGFFIIHPRNPIEPKVDRDFAIFLNEWYIEPGSSAPNPNIMLDFNTFSFNCKVWPSTAPLVVKTGQRVRIRFGNLSMDSHPIHMHGISFQVTGTDGGPVPPSARWPETTVNVPVGTTRDIEFLAEYPGDWALHCHKSHHTMNAMDHEVANLIGVNQDGLEDQIKDLAPGYFAMGETGMFGHSRHVEHLKGPRNTAFMMLGEGPFGPIEMGGMFTVVKVRDQIQSYEDPGWYEYPEGTVAGPVDMPRDDGEKVIVIHVCPMHPEVRQAEPGTCHTCGMNLIRESPPHAQESSPKDAHKH